MPILLYKSSTSFFLKPKISRVNEPIGSSILGDLYIGPVIVLDYSIFRFKSQNG